MKKLYPLKPCPWCKKTPQFHMAIEDTWMPHILCENFYCTVKPKSKYVSIRKKQKQNPQILQEKMERAINHWNENNPLIATDGFFLDFEILAQDSESPNLGNKDHILNKK